MDEFTNVADNGVDVATPQIEETNKTENVDAQSQVNDVATEKTNNEDITQTQSFSKRLKEETQKAIDQEYSRMFGEYGIHTKADYEKEIARQQQEQREEELRQKGIDPELEKLKEEVESMKLEKTLIKQADEMSKDPKSGELFKQWKGDIDNKLAELRNNGIKKADYDLAFTLVTKEKLHELVGQKPNIEEIKKQAIAEYIESKKTSNKPVEGSGTTPVVVASSPKNFNDAFKGTMELLKNMKENKNN